MAEVKVCGGIRWRPELAKKRRFTLGRILRVLRPYSGVPASALMLPPIAENSSTQGYLSLVLIAKNEATYILEWIEFHRMLGVDHVYLYDNGSTDDTLESVEPYIESGYLTWIPWVSFDLNARPQFQAYAHALCNFGSQWRWMGFIDVDEFFFPLQTDSLKSALSFYEGLPAIALHWHMFGFSGHKQRPVGLVIENYTKRAPVPSLLPDAEKILKWKSIVHPPSIKAVCGPHLFMLRDGRIGAYDENREWIVKDSRPHSASSILRLNHYFTKSESELATKMAKGSVGGKLVNNLGPKPWLGDRANSVEAETVTDDSILRFVAALNARLASETVAHRGTSVG